MQAQLTELIRIVSNLSDSVIDSSRQSAASAVALAAIQGEMLRLMKTKGMLTDEEAETLFTDALSNIPENMTDDAHAVFDAARNSFSR